MVFLPHTEPLAIASLTAAPRSSACTYGGSVKTWGEPCQVDAIKDKNKEELGCVPASSQSESFLTLRKIQDFRIRTIFLQLSRHVSCAVGLRLGLGGGSKAPAALDIFTMFTSLSSTSPICPWAEPPPPHTQLGSTCQEPGRFAVYHQRLMG